MRPSVFLVAISAMLLSACARERIVGRDELTVVRQGNIETDAANVIEGVLPPPARNDLILEERAYLIGPLDRLSIEVFGQDNLNRAVQTDLSGGISMPLVGSVQAAGRTPDELATELEDRLRKYLRDPQVTVNLTETVSQTFTVDGQVNSAGAYPAVGRVTLMRAIARAGGLSEFANSSYVVVFRQVDERQMAGLYDLRAIRQGIYDDPQVYANDVILVGENSGRRIFRDLLQGSGVLAAPLIAIVQR